MVSDRPASAQQQAYLHLRKQILEGQLPAGSLLKPEQVAQQIGVSRMPVREAIRQLDAEGLVVFRPNRRAVVQSLSWKEVHEIFEIRAVLEGLAARHAAINASVDDIADLHHFWDRMERAKTKPEKWIAHHDEFHQFVVRLAARPRLAAQINLLRDTCRPYFRLHISVYGRPEAPGFSEKLIIDALEEKDPAVAEQVMQEHVMAHSQWLEDYLRREASVESRDASAELNREAVG
ncbi:MAG: GntR family transcriptional regulator [Azospirillaceae bacterium]